MALEVLLCRAGVYYRVVSTMMNWIIFMTLGILAELGDLVFQARVDTPARDCDRDYGWEWEEWEKTPQDAYKKLWERINGKGSWEDNPWVWVIEFMPHIMNVHEFLKMVEGGEQHVANR